jgi:hypothetical protein
VEGQGAGPRLPRRQSYLSLLVGPALASRGSPGSYGSGDIAEGSGAPLDYVIECFGGHLARAVASHKGPSQARANA